MGRNLKDFKDGLLVGVSLVVLYRIPPSCPARSPSPWPLPAEGFCETAEFSGIGRSTWWQGVRWWFLPYPTLLSAPVTLTLTLSRRAGEGILGYLHDLRSTREGEGISLRAIALSTLGFLLSRE